jgi:hypothetical protein
LGADASRRAVWGAAKASLAAAGLSAIAMSLISQPRVGLALAAGLVVGAFTGVLTLRALNSGFPFRMASMTRLTIQTVLALGIGYLLGIDVIWVPVLGLVASNVILGAVAVRGTLATR